MLRIIAFISLAVACEPIYLDVSMDAGPDAALRANVIEPPANAQQAIAAVLTAYRSIYLTALDDLPEVRVIWTDERIPYGNGSVIGLHVSCGEIWVRWWPAIDSYGRIALAHEIGHCVRGHVFGDTDGAHADTAFWGVDGPVESARAAIFNAWL